MQRERNTSAFVVGTGTALLVLAGVILLLARSGGEGAGRPDEAGGTGEAARRAGSLEDPRDSTDAVVDRSIRADGADPQPDGTTRVDEGGRTPVEAQEPATCELRLRVEDQDTGRAVSSRVELYRLDEHRAPVLYQAVDVPAAGRSASPA
jgi:hypothetical protein